MPLRILVLTGDCKLKLCQKSWPGVFIGQGLLMYKLYVQGQALPVFVRFSEESSHVSTLKMVCFHVC
jgi:hypothetical protein